MMGYMEHEKAWNNFNKTFPKKNYSINNPLIKEFYDDLNDRLAGENLHEDGEISMYEASVKEANLMKKWRRLEAKVNQKLELIS